MQVTFGKHKGTEIKDLPLDYLMWGVDNIERDYIRDEFEKELEKRTAEGKEDYDDSKLSYNELIFGKDQTKDIVNISIKDDTVYLYKKDGTHEEFEYSPWVLSNQPSSRREAKKLKGNQYYKYLTTVSCDDFDHITNNRPRGVWFARGIQEAFMLEHGVTYFKGMKPNELSLCSIDIEATTLNRYADNAEVILVGITFRDRKGKKTRHMFDVHDYETQADLLDAVGKTIRDFDPDVILGHNIFGYDLPYMHNQSELKFGKDDSPITFAERVSKKRKDGSQSYDFHDATCHGRTILDTMFLSITYDIGRNFPSYGLKQIEKHLGLVDDSRVEWDFEKYPTKDYKEWPEGKWNEFKQYCEGDTDSPIAIFDLMIPPFFYLNQSVPKTMQQMINEATGSQLDSLMIRAYLQEGYSQPKTSGKVDFEGAISMGMPGKYENVRKVDVASLYPSIMLEKNIYDEKKDPKRYMLEMLEYFREERLKNKALAKDTKDQYYDDLQAAQKIVINSMYGFMGAGYLLYNYPKGAAEVTARGREILQIGVKWACGFELEKVIKSIKNKGKSNEEIKYHWVPGEKTSDGLGYTLVNVDTDSFSVTNGVAPSREEFDAEISTLNDLYSDYIVWEDDGVFDQVIVVKAKNYVLQQGDKIKYKGSSLTDQKKEPVLIQFLQDQITHILNDDKIEDLQETFKSRCIEVRQPKDIRDWCVKKTVTKSILSPERANEQKPLDACNEAIEKGVIKGIQEGDKIYLYQAIDGEIQKVTKGEPVFLKSGKPSMVENKILRYPELYNNDHDEWHYVKRVYNTLCILENVLDIEQFEKYHLKAKRALLDETTT